jgi:hypothetical protein
VQLMSGIAMMNVLQTMIRRIRHVATVAAILALPVCPAQGMGPTIPRSLL